MSPIADAWVVVPDTDLSDRTNWKALGDNRYSAFRALLYVKASNGDGWRHGPIVAAHNVNPNDTITVEHRRERIIKRTDSASQTLNESVSTRFLNSWTSKLASEAKGSLAGQSASISTELTDKFEEELTTSVTKALSHASSFEIQDVAEAKHQITLKGGDVPREAHFRRRFWPRHWDVYLYSVEYLELTYQRWWFWWQVRKTMKPLVREPIGESLFRVTFYEPQENLDVTYGPIQNELSEPHRITVEALTASLPGLTSPAMDSLEELARIAFPATSQERQEAETYRSHSRRAAKKAAARKTARSRRLGAAKKAGARKLASRRAAAKRAMKSGAKRGAAKRGTARKASKRASAKKARRK